MTSIFLFQKCFFFVFVYVSNASSSVLTISITFQGNNKINQVSGQFCFCFLLKNCNDAALSQRMNAVKIKTVS